MKTLFTSFTHALRGIAYVFRNENNFRIQVGAACVVVVLMNVFTLSRVEILVLILIMLLVLMLEIVNTAIEKFLDLLKPRMHGHVAVIKDVMAGAVLLSSITALVIGCIIFIPHIIEYFL